jgi:hypothetical protein
METLPLPLILIMREHPDSAVSQKTSGGCSPTLVEDVALESTSSQLTTCKIGRGGNLKAKKTWSLVQVDTSTSLSVGTTAVVV